MTNTLSRITSRLGFGNSLLDVDDPELKKARERYLDLEKKIKNLEQQITKDIESGKIVDSSQTEELEQLKKSLFEAAKQAQIRNIDDSELKAISESMVRDAKKKGFDPSKESGLDVDEVLKLREEKNK